MHVRLLRAPATVPWLRGARLRALLPLVLAAGLARAGVSQDAPPPSEGGLSLPGLPPAAAGAVEAAARSDAEKKKEEEEPGAVRGDTTSVSEVRVDDYGLVTIVAAHDDVVNVLQKLAVAARRNIVPSRAVSRPVTATIYKARLEDALEALLAPNGLGWIEKGEFLFVYTREELDAMSASERGIVSRVIQLDYIRAEDARDFAKPLLSEQGTIEASRDLETGGGGGGAPALLAGSSVSRTESIYTPEVDEYALRNAVVVHDYPENVDRVERFLLDLDTKPKQVLLEVTVVEAALSESNAYGIDFALMTGVDFTDFFNFPVGKVPIGIKTVLDSDTGNIVSPALPGNEGFVVSGAGNTGAGSATIRAGAVFGDDVGVFLRALDRVTNTTLLGNPKVLAVNRQVANVLVGTRIGYLETTVVENQVLQTVKFIDTGVALDIRPFILRDGRIRMEVSPKVSDVSFREIVGVSGLPQQIPDEDVQTVTTNILLPEGHTAVLGGLFREDTANSRSQTPWLGDLPLLGWLFRGRDDAVQRFEVMFLIRATVLDDETLAEQGRRGERYADRVRVGARLGLLPWSRERRTGRLNLAAMERLDAGDDRAALFLLRRSLWFDTEQPEVIRLLEKLGAGPRVWPSESLLERAIHRAHERRFGGGGAR